MTWKRLALLLVLVCAYQAWRECTRGVPRPSVADCAKPSSSKTYTSSGGFGDDQRQADPTKPALPASSGPSFQVAGFGITVPSWAMYFVPRPNEDLRAYRDRMLPLAQAAIAPQRQRVAHARDELAQLIHLDTRQRGELDAASSEAASALENRVMAAYANGMFDPATFKPMAGVDLAKGLLDDVEHGNQRWLSSLSEDQKAKLAQHPFDFADYMVFSTPWEDLLKLLD